MVPPSPPAADRWYSARHVAARGEPAFTVPASVALPPAVTLALDAVDGLTCTR